MTPQERALPHVIDGKRRVRIAAGSGTSVQQVNQLLDARKQMAKMMKGMSKGKMPDLGALTGQPPAAPVTGRPGSASRKKKKRSKSKARR
jgi:signal recognition particle subunit SRP54